jgi:two-component system sensor histidine kinase PilS (NtrC family)
METGENRIFGSQILNDRVPHEGSKDYWRSLYYFNLYRLLLAVFLVTASLADFNVGSLGSSHPDLFTVASFTYALLSILFMLSIHNGWPTYTTQCKLQILVDLIIIIILYHSSSGRGAGLEILFYVSVSASGILLGGRGALAAAAAASILLITEHSYVILTNQRPFGGFTTLGFIGGGLFITAFMIYSLTRLLKRSEVEVAQKNIDLEKLSHINDLIVEQLQSGVIVVDSSLKPILINQSGRKLLELEDSSSLPDLLEDMLPDIALKIYTADTNEAWKTSKIFIEPGKTLLIQYKPLGEVFQSGYIILVDDYSELEKEQRNEKFIAMGRLSASIAHEIRNPLGAISHAGQLLAESPSIMEHDSRLIEIIDQQSKRINQIIKTILDLGQSNEQKQTEFNLYEWLKETIELFNTDKKLAPGSISICGDRTIKACGDPEQLQHVVLNLLSNGVKYADSSSTPLVTLSINASKENELVTVSVTDSGPGIAPENQNRVFEPFFTTSSTGNGLGLYIARQICLGNHGALDYVPNKDGRHFFVITLVAGPCNVINTAAQEKA